MFTLPAPFSTVLEALTKALRTNERDKSGITRKEGSQIIFICKCHDSINK